MTLSGLLEIALSALLLAAQAPQARGPEEMAERLWDAARAGDTVRIVQAIERGADVNAKTRYGATALSFAANNGRLEAVRLLVERGADLSAQDTFYGMRALDLALGSGHLEIARFLLEKGSRGAPNALMTAIRRQNLELVKAALAGSDLDAKSLHSATSLAARSAAPEIRAAVEAAAKARPLAPAPVIKIDPAVLAAYAGTYRNEGAGLTVTVSVKDGQLVAETPGQPTIALSPTAEATFAAPELPNFTLSFAGRGGMIERMSIVQPNSTLSLERVVASDTKPASTAAAAGETKASVAPNLVPAPRRAPRPWPSFRGANASGIADGQGAVIQWDVASGKNIRWKTPIDGIANSSPVVWGDRVFLTTAISGAGDTTFRTGLYGDVKPVDDLSEHTWKIICLDKRTGKILWERTVFTGAPRVKRHTKSSQASSTPAVDGRRLVAVFGTIGLLVCYDLDGKLLWRKDLGVLDSGWFFDPTYQWGHSSSPVIYKDSVILQADQSKGSFLAAYDLAAGKEIWRTPRIDEISTWGTPTIYRSTDRDELVTNGTKVRGYDPETGRLLWTLGPNSEITVATPVAGDNLIFVTGGYPPVRPIYAIKPGSSGDISLAKGSSSSAALAWSNDREGTYIPTPLLYGGHLYTVNNNGILTAYDAPTGERVARLRVGGGGAFSASPIAADGRIYLASEDGDVFVIQAGSQPQELVKNEMKEPIMATPAISDGLIVIRTIRHVYGIGQ